MWVSLQSDVDLFHCIHFGIATLLTLDFLLAKFMAGELIFRGRWIWKLGAE